MIPLNCPPKNGSLAKDSDKPIEPLARRHAAPPEQQRVRGRMLRPATTLLVAKKPTSPRGVESKRDRPSMLFA